MKWSKKNYLKVDILVVEAAKIKKIYRYFLPYVTDTGWDF